MAGDRGDFAGLAGTFAEDGMLEGRYPGRGHQAIIDSLKHRRNAASGPDRPMPYSRHNLTTSLITFQDGTHATGRTYFIVCSDVGVDHCGVYRDRFVKVDGAWRIAHRKVTIDWVAENGHTRSTWTHEGRAPAGADPAA
jgi:hypothetical protein